MSSTVKIAAVAALVLVCLTPTLLAQAEADPNVLERVRIARDLDAILVPVTFKGKKYGFLFDTGSNHTVFDRTLRSQLGPSAGTVEATTASGVVMVDLFQPVVAALGRIKVQTGRPVGTLDLSDIREWSGCQVRGILGMDFLATCVVRIDWGKGELAFLRSPPQDAGPAIELTMDQGCPHVKLNLGGLRDESFMIDTGNVGFSGGLRSDLYRELASNQLLVNSGAVSQVTASGKSATNAGRLTNLSIGRYRSTNLLFNESQQNAIGLSLLSRFVVVFDFPKNQMYLKPGLLFHRPECVDASGLSLIERNDQVLIAAVQRHSPAHQTGLKPGDEVVTIGGMTANELRLFAMRQMLSARGQRIRLTIRRNGTIYLAELNLRRAGSQ